MAHVNNGATSSAAHGHGHDDGHHDLEALRMMGFWIFLITDCILFGTLFATYAVLNGNTAGGPTPSELFELNGVIAETFILLTSSFTSGLAVLSMNRGDRKGLIGWLAVTALLGAAVNLLTHPVLWWFLAPGASAGRFWGAEAVVVVAEAAMLWPACRRDPVLLLVTSLGANATSVLIGLLLL